MDNAKSIISINSLNVSYTNHCALKNVNVEIPEHKITAIIGPSGCGKTTLLKSFNRLIDLTDGIKVTGQIIIDGMDIYNDKKIDPTYIRKNVGLISQRPFPLPMSIYDNIAYGLRLNGAPHKAELDKIVEHNLKLAGLWDEVKDRLKSPASRLSQGQQQRLCLARCLAVQPRVILGDECTSALDPISSQRIEQTFRELKQDYTIVLVTHILRQAKRLADYVLFMYMGELIEHGPADNIFNNPTHPRTQSYIKGEIS